MSLKYDPQLKHVVYDPSAAFNASDGIARSDWAAVSPKIAAAQSELLSELEFYNRPHQLLADYRSQRRPSQLFLILGAARRIRDAVDRVIVLGADTICQAGRAVISACCHPYHNELSRGERGGKPRLYFVEDRLDNDALQGLLDLVAQDRRKHAGSNGEFENRWALIAVDPGGCPAATLEFSGGDVAAMSTVPDPTIASNFSLVLQVLLAELHRSLPAQDATQSDEILSERVILIGEPTTSSIDIPQWHGIISSPNSVPAEDRGNIFSPGVLLAASIVGVDIVRLLDGGRAMNERFQTKPLGENPPLDFATIAQLARERGIGSNLKWWNAALDASRVWHETLTPFAGCRAGQGSSPQRPLPLVTNVIGHAVRRDRLTPQPAEIPGESLAGASSLYQNDTAWQIGCAFPDLLAERFLRTQQVAETRGQPTANIHMPGLDEASMGQLFQMLMLAGAIGSKLTNT